MKFAIRLAITALIFWLIFRAIDVDQVWNVWLSIRPEWLLLALLLQFGSVVMAAMRWQWVMRAMDYGQDAWFYLRSYFKGMFFNQGLPTSIGGDALRVLDVASRGFRKRDAFVGVLTDRLIGLWALMLLNTLALLFSLGVLPDTLFMGVLLFVLTGSLGFTVLFVLHRWAWLQGHVVTQQIAKISSAVTRSFQGQALRVLFGSLAVHGFAMLSFWALGNAVGLDYGVLTYLAIVPPAILLTVIPVSLAGWGIREGALVGLFGLLQADTASVLAISILYGLVLIAVSLPGLWVYLSDKNRAV